MSLHAPLTRATNSQASLHRTTRAVTSDASLLFKSYSPTLAMIIHPFAAVPRLRANQCSVQPFKTAVQYLPGHCVTRHTVFLFPRCAGKGSSRLDGLSCCRTSASCATEQPEGTSPARRAQPHHKHLCSMHIMHSTKHTRRGSQHAWTRGPIAPLGRASLGGRLLQISPGNSPPKMCIYWQWGACYGVHWHPPRMCIHFRRWPVDCG